MIGSLHYPYWATHIADAQTWPLRLRRVSSSGDGTGHADEGRSAQTCATSALVGMAGAGRPTSESGRVVAGRDGVASDAPLRLKAAAALAFPGGTMTATGLRQEAKRGRLALMRIAGKDFTTLDAIEEMKQRCQLPSKEPASGSAKDARGRTALTGKRHGSSLTESGMSPRDALLTRLNAPNNVSATEFDGLRSCP